MTWTFKITRDMIDQVRRDLHTTHPFAAERVGFLFARVGNQSEQEKLILPAMYSPVQDHQYIDDPKVGACIDSSAIRSAMQTALASGVSVFHVHMHEHKGRPRFSRVDLANYPGFIGAMRNVAPNVAHGALLLSEDSCDALVWLPGIAQPVPGGRIVTTGRPTDFLEGGALYA